MIAAELTSLTWPALKQRVRLAQFPSAVIDRDLARFGQDQPERLGSELTDGYLAVLAAYADLTAVDKRTAENFRRARSKSSAFVAGRVDKTPAYQNLARVLRAG